MVLMQNRLECFHGRGLVRTQAIRDPRVVPHTEDVNRPSPQDVILNPSPKSSKAIVQSVDSAVKYRPVKDSYVGFSILLQH